MVTAVNETYTVHQGTLLQVRGTAKTVSSALYLQDFGSQSSGGVYWTQRATNAVIDTTHAASGAQSLKVNRSMGQPPNTCGGDMFYGGDFELPTYIPEGYNVWMRWKMYIPSTFSWGYVFEAGTDIADRDTCRSIDGSTVQADGNGWLKFFCYTFTDSYSRFYLQPHSMRRDVAYYPGFYINTDAALGIYHHINTASAALPLDQWFALQVRVKLDTTSNGTGDIWVDDTWVANSGDAHSFTGITLDGSVSGNKLRTLRLGDYWNGVPYTDGAGGRESLWMDEVIVLTDYPGFSPPTGMDGNGKLYIPSVAQVSDYVQG